MKHVHLGLATWIIFLFMLVVSLAVLHLLTDWFEDSDPNSPGAQAGHWLLGSH